MKFVGIDPGINGAIAFLDNVRSDGDCVFDLPRHAVDHRLDGFAIARLIRENVAADEPSAVFLEKIHAVANHSGGGAGAHQMGAMMESNGIIIGAIDCTRLTLHRVIPQKWKKFYRLDSDKDKSIAMARRLYPHLAGDLLRKKDDGRAEAVLIAHYGLAQTVGLVLEDEVSF